MEHAAIDALDVQGRGTEVDGPQGRLFLGIESRALRQVGKTRSWEDQQNVPWINTRANAAHGAIVTSWHTVRLARRVLLVRAGKITTQQQQRCAL